MQNAYAFIRIFSQLNLGFLTYLEGFLKSKKWSTFSFLNCLLFRRFNSQAFRLMIWLITKNSSIARKDWYLCSGGMFNGLKSSDYLFLYIQQKSLFLKKNIRRKKTCKKYPPQEHVRTVSLLSHLIPQSSLSAYLRTSTVRHNFIYTDHNWPALLGRNK